VVTRNDRESPPSPCIASFSPSSLLTDQGGPAKSSSEKQRERERKRKREISHLEIACDRFHFSTRVTDAHR